MTKKEKAIANHALLQIAKREGTDVKHVRHEIEKAMFVGLMSADPKVQQYWSKIPKEGNLPTVEEVILHMAKEMRG